MANLSCRSRQVLVMCGAMDYVREIRRGKQSSSGGIDEFIERYYKRVGGSLMGGSQVCF
jgi:hypothetical protein